MAADASGAHAAARATGGGTSVARGDERAAMPEHLAVPAEALLGFLAEDLGPLARDVTTEAIVPPSAEGSAWVIAREAAVVAGVEEALSLAQALQVTADVVAPDGARVPAGARILRVTGPARSLLMLERTMLNVMGRMSGIATRTAEAQEAVTAVNPACKVAATRKTTPGFRIFEKRAVVHGGGDPHRFGLYDQILAKDNHREAVPDFEALVERALAHGRKVDVPVQIEVEDLTQALAAADAGVDMILVDNQTPEGLAEIAAAVRRAAPTCLIEASGGITIESAPQFAPHCDRISMGGLTQAARAIDLSLEWDL